MAQLAAGTTASSASLAGVRQSIELLIPRLQVHVIPVQDDLTWRTHTSAHGVMHDPFERPLHLPILDYERREHVGDIVVGYYVTRLIDQKYPGLVVGQRSLLRSLLVANTTLCLISTHFGFPPRLRASEAQYPLLSANYRVQAAQFEAYLGTLDLEQPREVVAAFVEQIFAPLAAVAYDGLRELFVHPIPLSATSSFCSAESSQDGASSTSSTGGVPVNYVGKMMEWAMERGHAHQRTVTFRKIESTSPPPPSPNGGPVLPVSEYELEWRDLAAEGEPLAKGLKVRGEGRTVKVAKAVAAHLACTQLGI